MKIAIFIETLLVGGAELFALRMADFLSKDHEVVLYNVRGSSVDAGVKQKIQQSVFSYESFSMPMESVVEKFDSLLFRFGIDISIRNFFLRKHIMKVLKSHGIEVIHSNQFKVDEQVSKVNEALHLPHTITIHGDYITFFQKLKNHQPLRILNYERKFIKVLQKVDHIACISDQQIQFFNEQLPEVKNKLIKIYNGYFLPEGYTVSDNRAMHGISPTAFVYGMVARGIAEKGWEVLIRAFLKLEEKDVYLLLVGDSSYIQSLRKKYSHDRIIFAGQSAQPLDWISMLNAGVLPTWYSSESLPTSVIEYLALEKPVIATRTGEIAAMLDAGQPTASGVLISIKEGKASEEELVQAMKLLRNDEDYYKRLKQNTQRSFQKFNMKHSAEQYLNIYTQNTKG